MNHARDADAVPIDFEGPAGGDRGLRGSSPALGRGDIYRPGGRDCEVGSGVRGDCILVVRSSDAARCEVQVAGPGDERPGPLESDVF